MENLTEREKSIVNSALQLCVMYADRNLANDGHEIFRMARDAIAMLTLHYDYDPLACRIADDLVKCGISLYRENHAA